MRTVNDATEDPTKRQKIPWKRYRRDGKLKADRHKREEKAYRMAREVAKTLRIPFLA